MQPEYFVYLSKNRYHKRIPDCKITALKSASKNEIFGLVCNINHGLRVAIILLLEQNGTVSGNSLILHFSKIHGYQGKRLELLKQFGPNGFEIGIIVKIILHDENGIRIIDQAFPAPDSLRYALLVSELKKASCWKKIRYFSGRYSKKMWIFFKKTFGDLFAVQKRVPF